MMMMMMMTTMTFYARMAEMTAFIDFVSSLII
jgi:hypothetical protein